MKIWLITEIPGPYRNPHFQELTRQFEDQGATFSVHFMSEEDDIRPDSWFDKSAISYPHFFYPKTTLRIGRRKIYWNRSFRFSFEREARLDHRRRVVVKPDVFRPFIVVSKNRLIGWVELNEMVLGVSNPVTN